MTAHVYPSAAPTDDLWTEEEFSEAWDGLGPLTVRVFVTLGLPEILVRGPQSVHLLARACAADPETLGLLLGYLAVRGVVETRDGGYGLSPQSFRLLRSHPEGISPWLDDSGPGALMDAALRDVTKAVLSGQDWFHRVRGQSFYDVMATTDFAELRGEHGTRLAETLLGTDLFEGAEQLVDVGGGDGSFLMAVLGGLPPHVTAVLLDLPSTVEGREAAVGSAGLSQRLTVVGGDFFASVSPCSGVMFLSNVLHNWSDEDARRILTTCSRALYPGARLVVIEGLTDRLPPRVATAMDLRMKLLCGGRERSGAAIDTLARHAGLRRSQTLELTPEHTALVYCHEA